MDSEDLAFFRAAFAALSGGRVPFPWQERLFLSFCQGEIPASAALPTGCGKTAVMLVWLIALAWQARNGPGSVSLPRRLVWVVNRRAVVDQATTEAEKIRKRLVDDGIAGLGELRRALARLSGGPKPLGISTLRGQFADNGEWCDDPARPAIIVGTVDMIGSRLLFSGYGLGFRRRPLHAGFLGQDALLVHDEAHLEPAFQKLIEAVRDEQKRCGDFRRFHVMGLTATSRGGGEDAFRLTEEDRASGTEIQRRIEARKGLALHRVESDKQVAAAVAERALEFRESGAAILIFLRTLKDVEEVRGKLRGQKVLPLTGTIRGLERDWMSQNDPIFARFSPDSPAAPEPGTVYLVCTSAGEVGVNLSADHLVCDLTPFDSMAQRFGRVNRFGTGDARIELVYAPVAASGSEFDQARARTLELLQKLPQRDDGRLDASPAALEELPAEERAAAFSPAPATVPASDILFDRWAMTSIRGREPMPGRPPAADWLHGTDQAEPPQTWVAWRQEVQEIRGPLAEQYPPEELLDDYPLKPHELLRDASRRIVEQLKKLAARVPAETDVWLVDGDGAVKIELLSELVKREPEELRDCTVLLPPQAGGLTKEGMLDGSAEYDGEPRYDVADDWAGGSERKRVHEGGGVPGMRLVRRINVAESDEEPPQYWSWYVREAGSRAATAAQELDVHSASAERIARGLAARAGLPDTEAEAIAFAAKWHDAGKRRAVWQRSIGNREYPDRVLAKSGPEMQGAATKYRHEFGSLIDMAKTEEFRALPPEMQDLVLHVVAAHHGRARPHFTGEEAFDLENAAEGAAIAPEVPRRYARLQRRYGRWGLAYLESLVRAADAQASQEIPSARAAGGER